MVKVGCCLIGDVFINNCILYYCAVAGIYILNHTLNFVGASQKTFYLS